jgi:periplasmic copper chaperone A
VRVKTITALLGAAALLAPRCALAHVSLHPNTIPAGAFVTLDVRVPGEEENAYAYKVDMLLPPGFTEVDTQNVPGWSVKESTVKLKKPLRMPDGPVDEEVSQIVWTGDRSTLGRLENGTFIQFPLSIAMPEGIAGKTLAFKTLEFYSNGKVAHWIGSPDASYPAPTVDITPKGGVIEDVAGGEAGPAGQGPTSSSTEPVSPSGGGAEGASEGLGIAALAIGVLGLLTGATALVVARRRSAAGSNGGGDAG